MDLSLQIWYNQYVGLQTGIAFLRFSFFIACVPDRTLSDLPSPHPKALFSSRPQWLPPMPAGGGCRRMGRSPEFSATRLWHRLAAELPGFRFPLESAVPPRPCRCSAASIMCVFVGLLVMMTLYDCGSQERQKFFAGVGFIHSFGCLVDFEIGFCVALFVAPREKTFQRACVTVDRTVGQPFLSHLKNHVVEGCRIEAIDGEGHIQSFRNCVKMLFVSCYGFVFNSSRCDC